MQVLSTAKERPVLDVSDINHDGLPFKVVEHVPRERGDADGKGTSKPLPGLRVDPTTRDSSLRLHDIEGSQKVCALTSSHPADPVHWCKQPSMA